MAKTKTTVQKEKTATKVTKTIKPLYTVDLTDVETIDEVGYAFAMAKFNAKQPLNEKDLEVIVWNAKVDAAIEMASLAATILSTMVLPSCVNCTCQKKPNVFKRIWNWITRKK